MLMEWVFDPSSPLWWTVVKVIIASEMIDLYCASVGYMLSSIRGKKRSSRKRRTKARYVRRTV